MSNRKRIVISGINLFEGGTLSVFRDLCDSFIEYNITSKYDVVLFVHKIELFKKYMNHFDIIEIPKSRENWFNRIYFEYFYFKKYSKKNSVYIWISIHDMTPNVKCEHMVTYCHNATPFYDVDRDTWRLDKKVYLFSKFYKYLYRINIKKNDFVIVQQNWIANKFKKMYPIKEVKVFYPKFKINSNSTMNDKKTSKITFFYPTFPRVFKNIELICEAVKLLEEKNYDYEVIITIEKNQNSYAQNIIEKYKHLDSINFIGTLEYDRVIEIYKRSDCLLFPSKLETWGLPITEFKAFKKVILAADLEYAHETVGEYDLVNFFDPNDAQQLADKMEDFICGKLIFTPNINQKFQSDFSDWNDVLLNIEMR